MKPILYIVVGTILIIGCDCLANIVGQKDSVTNDIKCTKRQNLEETDFKLFLELFSSDSILQLEHIVFPLKYTSVDIEDNKEISFIRKEEWKILHFNNDKESQNRETDAYQQLIEEKPKSAKVFIQGIDNGIDISFLFEKRNRTWFLIEWNDLSN